MELNRGKQSKKPKTEQDQPLLNILQFPAIMTQMMMHLDHHSRSSDFHVASSEPQGVPIVGKIVAVVKRREKQGNPFEQEEDENMMKKKT